jgi:hypothetical protein
MHLKEVLILKRNHESKIYRAAGTVTGSKH